MGDSSNQPTPAWAMTGKDLGALFLGAALFVLTQPRFGVGAIAFLSPVPFLFFVRRSRGWKPWFWLFVAILAAFHLCDLKIVTAPAAIWLVPTFAVPASLGLFAVLWLWDIIRRRAGEVWALYAFPCLIVLLEWTQYAINEFGVWGTFANTQLHNLPLLQLAALVGASGISFLVTWAASLIEQLFASRSASAWRYHVAALGLAWTGALLFGAVRLDGAADGPQVRVAAVSADVVAPGRLPTDEESEQITKTLFLRSTTAAQRGAQVVVWNEAATLVAKTQEAVFVNRVRDWAVKKHAHLVAGYATAVSEGPPMYENKYVWMKPDGTIGEVYLKHHPVPGEPCVRGNAALAAIDTEWGRAAGAIGYDYDFPPLVRAHARLGVGLAVIAASDWRGIDPLHPQMARLRAIEGGFSLLRSAHLAASAAFDGYGRVRAMLPYFENNDRILVVTLPVASVGTLYSRIGDTLVYLAMGFLSLTASIVTWRLSHPRRTR
jgi:apolipoprotein N-acyltransferase